MFASRDGSRRRVVFGLCIVPVLLFGLCAPPVVAQILEYDFDSTGPTATADLPAFFDFFARGGDNISRSLCADDAGEHCWRIKTNDRNADNGTNAVYQPSIGGRGGHERFSRVSILKESEFLGDDFRISATITFDDDNDQAGIYIRFNEREGVDPNADNGPEYYFIQVDASNNDCGGNSKLELHRSIGGSAG